VTLSGGWTGGQYSVYRALLGAALATHLALALRPDTPAAVTALLLLGAAFALALALGAADRVAALALCAVGAVLYALDSRIFDASFLWVGILLLAHACVPAKPYGSFAARGRIDPRGDWSMPPGIVLAAWLVLCFAHAIDGTVRLMGSPSRGSRVLGVAHYVFPGFYFASLRPWVWLALLGVQLLLPLLGASDLALGVVLLHGLTFDPRWVPPRRDASPATLFYDGACGLCHRAVRFVLAEDLDGRGFRYAPLASDAFRRLVSPAERAALPDSLVLVTPDGRVRSRSAALRETGSRLGGVWRVLAWAAGIVPVGLLDLGYDWIARMRSRMFARPADVCPILPADLRKRFD
jgi:predicted DCC family thiol-disulfide oxidoreductase YuxK